MSGDSSVRRSELMAAISLGTDIGMGLPLETGLGCCVVAVGLARRLGVDDALAQRVHRLALLQHIGCTASAATASAAVGDELEMRRSAATVDFADKGAMARLMVAHVVRTNPPLARPAALARAVLLGGRIIGTAPDVCETARMLGERFGYDAAHLADIDCVYEYWDGGGFPGRVGAEEISLPARIVHAASLAVAAHQAGGVAAASDIVAASSGHRIDPAIGGAMLSDLEGLLQPLDQEMSLWTAAVTADPAAGGAIDDAAVDETLRAVADFVDIKSVYLLGHSSGVAALAAAAADHRGLSAADVVAVRRAGWLHDLGRIGVSLSVWSHKGPLTPHQREQIRLHPYYTDRILSHTPFLRSLAAIAGAHHERLDGSGYHRGATAGQLSPAACILAAADAFHAKLEERPYRSALSPDDAARELRSEVAAGRIDADSAAAVLAAAGQAPAGRQRRSVAGLTPREIETLRLVARGLTIRQIARLMVIAPKTVDGNIQRIYAKIGTSTRSGAAIFAMQHNLVTPDQATTRETAGS